MVYKEGEYTTNITPIDYSICPKCNGQGCFECDWKGEFPIYENPMDMEDEE